MMKKIILTLALAAFIGGGTLVFATTNNSTESIEMIQDGKKKSTATKKDDCKDKKSDCKDKKSDCKDSKISKKSCCSDGKNAKKKTSSPEKK